MGQRNSQAESDDVMWQTVAVPLGKQGLDLRESGVAGLTRLDNAQFTDDSTLVRRHGHIGNVIRDGSDYFQALDGSNPVVVPMGQDGWVYGHGQRLTPGPLTYENAHVPAPGFARGTFRLDDTDVVWTGDRVLVARDGLRSLGESLFWGVSATTTPLKYGLPAYIPVQTDSFPPDTINGNEVSTCLTNTLRVVVADDGAALYAWVIDRDTGEVINKSDLGGGNNASSLRVFESGPYVVCVWLDSVSKNLYINYWTGVEWNGASVIDASVDTFEVAPVPGGFHIIWRVAAAVYVGRYAGKTTQETPYAFQTLISTPTAAPNGPVAIAAAPNDAIGIVWQDDAPALKARVYYDAALTISNTVTIDTVADHDAVTICSRLLSVIRNDESPRYQFVVHSDTNNGVYSTTSITEFDGGALGIYRSDIRYNCRIASKSFRVGNEVFCWLRSDNSTTLFLVAGGGRVQVSGIADREEGAAISTIPAVLPDPRSTTGSAFTWARLYDTGDSYTHGGNARIGDLEFLPALSAVQYGRSVYLAGSHVRNWDGQVLGDAGFHDYPLVRSAAASNGAGSLTALGSYSVRVYAVRYNKRGERFQSAAVTSATTSLAGAEDTIVWTISTVPVTNHSDVIFEVYRTQAGGTTYYLDGTVANNLAATTVTFTSLLSDSALGAKPADPHETGVASADETEEFGPLGCAHLAVSADRLWGAGGQVPPGWVQFSKLKENGEGAGFDALAGAQQIDTEGGAITSIVGSSDALVVFERDRIYVLFGSGPDNFGNGSFSTPQMVLSDGAITHLGSAVTQDGVVYWGVNGPRLLTHGFKVENISAPILPLTATMTPTGVQIDLSREEIIWYTAEGGGLLLNYRAGLRWSKWTGLRIAGCSSAAMVTTDGVLLKPADDTDDAGVPFALTARFARLRPEDMQRGHTIVRRAGLTGEFKGAHDVRFRMYYDGAPLWSEEFTWEPGTNSWLIIAEEVENMTPVQFDALGITDHSGSYGTDKRLHRQTCRFLDVEISDVSADGATFTPHELVFELGMKPGLGRTAVNTFRD